MTLRPFALAAALIALPAAAQQEAATAEAPASAPATRMALTGDFVELGEGHPAAVRGSSSLEIVNRTLAPLDVKLGSGSGRIEPGRSLLVKIDAGAQPLEVTSPGAPGDALKGVLQLQKGHAYALGVAFEAVRVSGRPVPAAEDAAAAGKLSGEPAARATAATQAAGGSTKKGEIKASKRKRSGRVDIGRKRKRDR